MSGEPSVVVADELQPGTMIASNYRVIRRLGSGGFGTVYLGENVTLEQKVVIKTLQVGVRGAGAEEARALASLDHPNVVHVYAYDERFDCIVMQHLAGKTVVDELNSLDLVSSIRVAYQAALALSAVHERGLVHRDVKPENLMIELKAGEVRWLKLIDLGTAMREGRTIAQPAGTPDYCPPEQFDPDAGALPANDIYALGVTLFLLCSGRFPFEGNVNELAQHHFSSPVPDLAATYRAAHAGKELEPRLEMCLDRVGELVSEMMAKEARKRPDARRVAQRLSELESDFATERTQAGYQMPPPSQPLQLTAQMRTSTIVLPKRKASSTSASIAAAMPASRSSTWLLPGVLGAVVVLLGIAVWWISRADPGVEPSIRDAGAPNVVVAVVEPVKKVDPPPLEVVDAGSPPQQELVPLPNPTAVKQPVKVRPPPVVEKCVPDDRWRRTLRAELAQQRDEVGKRNDGKLYAAWEDDERKVLKKVVDAQSAADCADAMVQVDRLINKYTP